MPLKDKAKRAAINRLYREKHRERLAAMQKARRVANPGYGRKPRSEMTQAQRDRYNARSRANYAAHPEKKILRSLEYQSSHREKCNVKNRAYRQRHPDRAKASARKWHIENPDMVRAKKHRRRAMERGTDLGTFTDKEWTAIKEAYHHRCAYCHKRAKLTVEHVVPLSKGGVHCSRNIVPACWPCNLKKGVKDAPTYQPVLFL